MLLFYAYLTWIIETDKKRRIFHEKYIILCTNKYNLKAAAGSVFTAARRTKSTAARWRWRGGGRRGLVNGVLCEGKHDTGGLNLSTTRRSPFQRWLAGEYINERRNDYGPCDKGEEREGGHEFWSSEDPTKKRNLWCLHRLSSISQCFLLLHWIPLFPVLWAASRWWRKGEEEDGSDEQGSNVTDVTVLEKILQYLTFISSQGK